MRLVVCFLVLAACGRIGFDATTDSGSNASAFEQLATPAGGTGLDVVTSPDSLVLYARLGGRGFRSSDRGASWLPCAPTEYLATIAVDQTDPQLVYVSDGAAVYRSVDACASWAMYIAKPGVNVIRPVGTTLLLGASGIYRYSGGTLTPLPSAIDGYETWSIVVSPSGTILATSYSGGIVRSTDSGTSFQAANGGLPSLVVYSALYPNPAVPTRVLVETPNGTYLSTNDGVTWTAAPGGIEGRWSLASDRGGNANHVLSATWRGFVESNDGGSTFGGMNLRATNMDSSAVNMVEFDPSGSGRAYAATGRGMFFEPNVSGSTWTDANAGLSAWEVGELDVVPGTDLIYAASSSGVLRSGDNGETWTNEAAGMENAQSGLSSVQVGVNGSLWASNGWIWESADSGRTFIARDNISTADAFWAPVIRSTGTTLWAGTATRLLRSDDAGTSWIPHPIDASNHGVNDLAITPASELWVATQDGTYFSSDGTTFAPQPDGFADPQTLAVKVLADGSVIVGSTNGVLCGTSPPTSWTDCGLDGRRVIDLAVTATRWIAATDRGVFVSANNGTTWTELPGLTTQRPSSLAIDRLGRLLVGTAGFGIYRAPL